MDFLQQLFLLPYAFVWIPAGIFGLVVGGAYAFTRRIPQFDSSTEASKPPEPKKEPIKEKRNMFRRQGNPVEVQVAFPDDRTSPAIGSLMDRSVGGMKIAMFHEIPVGSIIVVRPERGGEMAPWVELEIRSCRPSTEMSEQYEIGCQYVKVPPYSIQLLFG